MLRIWVGKSLGKLGLLYGNEEALSRLGEWVLYRVGKSGDWARSKHSLSHGQSRPSLASVTWSAGDSDVCTMAAMTCQFVIGTFRN